MMYYKIISQTLRAFLGVLILLSFISCEKDPITVALHSPISPTGNQQVTYSLSKETAGAINSAKLYEQINTINNNGDVIATGAEVLLQTWNNPHGDLSFTKNVSNGNNKLVTYRWEVVTPEQNKKYKITYATRPYPVANMPVPIYCQGDPDDVFDVVFIPDTDISNMANFYTNCSGAIKDAFFDEPHTQFWRKQYNFYVNMQKGTATDYNTRDVDGLHQPPANFANLAFAEARVLMHENDLRDYASGGLFSTEMQNRGTILHESGHSLYSLADEYNGGAHWQEAINPNNWSSLANAQAAGSKYGDCKTPADASQIATTGWYQLCDSNCQMEVSGLNHTTYDCPCKNRITFTVLDNIIN